MKVIKGNTMKVIKGNAMKVIKGNAKYMRNCLPIRL